MYFYKCKGFSRRQTGPSLEGERSLPQVWRQIWVFLFKWDGYMFRFIVKKVNSKQIGRGDNDSKKQDFIISHVQFVGVESLATKYAYTLNIFEAKSRKRSQEFQGIVTTTQTTIEECIKSTNGKCLFSQKLRPENLKKSRPKKLVKSNKLISRIYFCIYFP